MGMARWSFVLVAAMAALLQGCTTSNPYDADDRAEGIMTLPIRVGVAPYRDERPFEEYFNRALSFIPVLGITAPYYYDRHDDIYRGSVVPFSEQIPGQLAARMQECGVFASVEAIPPDQPIQPGEYDVIVQGTMNRIRSKGGLYRWGLSIFGDLFWTAGVPYLSRRWELDIDYQLINGYTLEPIGEVHNESYTTGRSMFTRYYNRGRVTDLRNKLERMHDSVITWIWESKPDASSPYWAELRTEGQEYLANLRRQEELRERGTPPTFAFLSPSDDSTLRTPVMQLRWNITAPNGLKDAVLVVNNRRVDLGINAMDMARVDSAPTSIAARDLNVPLELGENSLEALVVDHRGNETTADLTITRLPAELRPTARHALLVTDGGADARQAVEDLRTVLADPMIGQFAPAEVTVLTPASLTRSGITSALRDFGLRPLAGQLAFLYLDTDGDAGTLALTADGMTLSEFVEVADSALATDEVVMLLDVDWSGEAAGPIFDQVTGAPGRWAILLSQAEGGASPVPAVANAASDLLRGDGSTRRLTLERLLDGILNALDEETAAPYLAEAYGRYDVSITMAERE